MQGVLEPIQPTIPSRAFEAGLAALTPPAAFLAPLGHEISPEAPSGLVSGVASPAPLPVQRRPADDLGYVTPPAPRSSRAVTGGPAIAADRGNALSSGLASLGHGLSGAAAPGPVGPNLAGSNLAGSSPARPNAAGDSGTPAPLGLEAPEVVTAAAARPLLTAAPAVTTIERSLSPVAPLPVQRAATPSPAPLRSRSATPVPGEAQAAPAPMSPGAPMLGSVGLSGGGPATDGPSPHASPGAPSPASAAPPPLASVQRHTAAPSATTAPPVGPAATAAGTLPVVQRRAGLGAPMAERPPFRPAGLLPPAANPSMGSLSAGPPDVGSSALPSPAVRSLPVDALAPSGAPLLGDAPVEIPASATFPVADPGGAAPSFPAISDLPLVIAQRLPSPSLSGTVGGEPAARGLLPSGAPQPLLAPVQRRAERAEPRAVPINRWGQDPDVSVQPNGPGGSAAVSPAEPPQPLPVPTGAMPAPTRSAAGRLPAASSATQPSTLQRSVVRPEPVRAALSLPALPATSGLAVQRQIGDLPTNFSGPEAVPNPPPPSAPAVPELPAVPAVPAGLPDGEMGAGAVTSGAAAVAGAALPTGDLDALAGRLYDKIRYRLKAELRLDRERAGLITDRR